MNRWFLVLAGLGVALWIHALGGLILGAPVEAMRPRADRAAAGTLAVHLLGVAWLRRTRLAPSPEVGPAWAFVQAEKHRRKGQVFAGWGAVIGSGWFLARPASTPIGGMVGFVLALNLSFQPAMFLAEALVIDARVKLGRGLAGMSSAERVGPDLTPQVESDLGRI